MNWTTLYGIVQLFYSIQRHRIYRKTSQLVMFVQLKHIADVKVEQIVL